MPIVDIKGVGQARFPDEMATNDIRNFLRNKYSQRAVGGQSDALSPQADIAAPYKPSLMEKAGQGIADVLSDTGVISNRAGAQQIGKNVTSIGELLPGIGDVAAVDDFVRAKAKGDNLGMGLAALGVLPVAGDLAGKAGKNFRKVFHGGSLDVGSRQSNNLTFVAEDIEQATQYAKNNNGIVSEFSISESDIIDEDDAIGIMNELGIKPLDKDWSLDEASIYEALDPEFEQFIGDDNVKILKDEMKKRGHSAISFKDVDITPQGTGRQTASNLVMMDNPTSQAPVDVASSIKPAFKANQGAANMDAMLDLLKPKGQAANIGFEKGAVKKDGIAKFTSPNGSTRYVMMDGGEPVSALQIMSRDGKDGVISNVFTLPSNQKKGLASKLMGKAKKDFKSIKHSDELTEQGARFANSVEGASQVPTDAGKTLFKTHNVTAAGLRKADEFGGIPVPSLAIADRSAGFDDFGEISLIGEKGSFAKDPTFASDVYSPRTPKVTHDIDRAAARAEASRVSGDVDPRIDSGFDSQFEASNLEDDITRLESSAGNKAAFLSTIGKAINPDKFTSKPAKFKEPEWVKEFGFDLDSPVTFKSFDEPEFTQKAEAFLTDMDPKREAQVWWDNGEMTREAKKTVLVSLRDTRLAHQAAKGGPQFDRTKARAEIDKRIKKNQSSFDSYISDQKGRISKGKTFTKWNPKTSTNKKFEANLDNAVKLMKGNIRGGEGFGYGVGSIRAQVAPKLTSMKQITDRRGQIVGSDEMTMVKEGFNSRLDNLYDDLSGNWAFSSEPSYSDFADGIENAAKGDFGDFKNLSPNQKNELKGFFDELANAPTNYFEIKPQRAVDINEFFGAAVPEGTSKDVIAQLKAKGLKIEKYKPEKRLEAIEKLNIKSKGNIFFSGAGAALLYNVTKEDDKPTD